VRYLDLTLPGLGDNLALDEALLLQAEAGEAGETLRVWEWPTPAVILGAGGRVCDDVIEDACHRDRVPILRRSSGGGTVLLGRGCLLFSLILSYGRAHELTGVRRSYEYILDRVGDGLRGLAPGVERAGISDLAIGGRKFSGNAQQRKRRFMLHHGTILYDFDLAEVGRYLHLPRRRPDYRGQRSHDDFLVNLPVTALQLRSVLCERWEASTEGKRVEVPILHSARRSL
jgi:lipoate-protein ligase A